MSDINVNVKVRQKKLTDIKPYWRNPRDNDESVPETAASIKRFGFKVPIVVDLEGVIVTGHTRYKAATELGLATVPVIVADDLTPAECKAYRLADNKVGEKSKWNEEALVAELLDLQDTELLDTEEIKMDDYGFDLIEDDGQEWFEQRERFDDERQEGNEEYNAFLEKFEIKKTTDDCYTPDKVYEAVADWVANEYGLNRDDFVRPFYPGADYQAFGYKKHSVVVDNPPFSILSQIIKWYTEHGVQFFLFAPALTLFSSAAATNTCAVGVGVSVIYENKASVSTSFLTNLENLRFRTAPTLYKAVDAAVQEVLADRRVELTKNDYPDQVLLSTMLSRYSKYGIDFKVTRDESQLIRELDAQREKGKAIYGGGFLLSERAAAERAAAERAAAERWALSAREWSIVKELSHGSKENAGKAGEPTK